MAHIVAESPDGPRGTYPLPLDQRNSHSNLILLCNTHHQLIDDPEQAGTYTVERLRGIKQEHEEWVERTLSHAYEGLSEIQPPQLVTETLYSNLLPVDELPRYIFGAPCNSQTEREIDSSSRERLREMPAPFGRPTLEMAPFILRGGMLFAFQNLNEESNPFHDWVRGQPIERYCAADWWRDPDRMRWYVDLLNRALNKLTGRRGLMLDRDHHRYYFEPDEPGRPVKKRYRSVNGRWTTRTVVWEPKKRKTGEGRGYWLHRAVSLRFTQYDSEHWFLGIRPELRATVDGLQPLPSEKVGSKVTREKARRFNYDLLSEVHFWRDYLGESKPRIIMPFGPKQRVIISTTPMSGEVSWPGIPVEHAKPFTNVEYIDDLFTWAEINALSADSEGPDWDEEEEEDQGDDSEEE